MLLIKQSPDYNEFVYSGEQAYSPRIRCYKSGRLEARDDATGKVYTGDEVEVRARYEDLLAEYGAGGFVFALPDKQQVH